MLFAAILLFNGDIQCTVTDVVHITDTERSFTDLLLINDTFTPADDHGGVGAGNPGNFRRITAQQRREHIFISFHAHADVAEAFKQF